jgi:hypothetical protein
MAALVAFVLGGGSVVVFLLLYWGFLPDQASKVAGQVFGILARIFKGMNKTAVALRVQGTINGARSGLLKDAPEGILEEKLKLRWSDADEAVALLREGEVLVVMQPADHHEENLANAVMAYLPKALLPQGRRYVDPQRMRAAELVVARAILDQEGVSPGALPIFFEDHLDPARQASPELEAKLTECDAIDLQGWLVRVLLREYQLVGTQLYPSDPSAECLKDAEELARFVAAHAERELGDDSMSRIVRTRHFSIAIIYVALRKVVEREGLAPYLKRAKRYLFRDRLDGVYLMAYDHNIGAVNTVADGLEAHGWVDTVDRHEYALRADFAKRRNIHRDRAIVVCLRGRQVESSDLPGEDFAESPSEELDFPEEIFGADGQESRAVASDQEARSTPTPRGPAPGPELEGS